MNLKYDPTQRILTDDDSGWSVSAAHTTRDAATRMVMTHRSGATVEYWAQWYDPSMCAELGIDSGRFITGIIYREAGEQIDPKIAFRLPHDAAQRGELLKQIQTYTAQYIKHRLQRPDARVEISLPKEV